MRTGAREGMRALAFAQGAYYALTGIWPLVSLGTFLIVTGPKVDLWLVQTVGALVLVMGAALLVAAWEEVFPVSVWTLAIGSAVAFFAVDVVFYLQGEIGAVYLLDAALQAVFALGWGILAIGRVRAPRATA